MILLQHPSHQQGVLVCTGYRVNVDREEVHPTKANTILPCLDKAFSNEDIFLLF
jgi:hypothetical protein